MSMPTSLLGVMDSMDINAYGSVVDYLLENTPALMHPESVRTFARMRHDPMLTAILQAYGGPIDSACWSIDGDGCRDEVTQRVADDLGLPINGVDEDEAKPTGARRRRFTWDEHLRLAGLYRAFGHMFFEQAWAEIPGGWRLDIVQERMPQTIAALHLNKDGTLASIEQNAVATVSPPKITTADHRLIYYTRQREGSNYFGESMLRPSYGPWLIKDQMLRVHATSIRRFGMGIPTAQALPGTNPTPQQLAEAQRVVGGMRASEHFGVAMPAGFRLALEGMTGNVPDALAFINFLNQEMARSTLTMLLTMAGAERGNRSLGETVMDMLILAQQADANAIARDGTAQIVIPLVDANWGEDETAPKIKVGNVGADVETTAQDIYWLMAYAGIKADAPFRAWVRQLRGIPAEDPNDPVFALPAPNLSQPDPNAPTTEAP
jgi:hypothetical protein